jgi:hypothetical protein
MHGRRLASTAPTVIALTPATTRIGSKRHQRGPADLDQQAMQPVSRSRPSRANATAPTPPRPTTSASGWVGPRPTLPSLLHAADLPHRSWRSDEVQCGRSPSRQRPGQEHNPSEQAASRRRTSCNQPTANDTRRQQTPRSEPLSLRCHWSGEGDACLHTAEATGSKPVTPTSTNPSPGFSEAPFASRPLLATSCGGHRGGPGRLAIGLAAHPDHGWGQGRVARGNLTPGLPRNGA